MKKFFSLTLFFPLLFILLLMLSLVKYNSEAINEIQEIMMRDAADAAADAAVYEARRISHIDMYGRVTLDPESVWREYKRAFLRAMDLYSDINMERFEAYCPATVIAVNDGYFIRMRTVDSDGQIVVRFSQKIPFAREISAEHGSEIVADTMNGMHIYSFIPNLGQTFVRGDSGPEKSVKGGVHDISAIAEELIKAMDYCIEVENASVTNSIWDSNRFYIPKELIDTVYYDAVTFKGLSLMNLIQGFDMKGNKPIDYFTISNTQLVNSKQYACYEYKGKRYYSPADELPEASSDKAITIVASKEQAAILGYYPDPRYYKVF